jgi:gas vesicle protein
MITTREFAMLLIGTVTGAVIGVVVAALMF